MLTDAQYNALCDLGDAATTDIPWNPYDVFPARDNADNGRRRAIASLVRKGLLQGTGRGFVFCASPERLRAALREYRIKLYGIDKEAR